MKFEFRCPGCGKIHEGMPSFGAEAPLSYYEVAESERASRCDLGSDDCVIDRQWFFVRGCLEIPVHGANEPFSWSVWVSLSEPNFRTWLTNFDQPRRSHVGPFFGWLNAWLKPYPQTTNLKTNLHLRDNGVRPLIQLQACDHPLAVEQRDGIAKDRVAEIYAIMMHEKDH